MRILVKRAIGLGILVFIALLLIVGASSLLWIDVGWWAPIGIWGSALLLGVWCSTFVIAGLVALAIILIRSE